MAEITKSHKDPETSGAIHPVVLLGHDHHTTAGIGANAVSVQPTNQTNLAEQVPTATQTTCFSFLSSKTVVLLAEWTMENPATVVVPGWFPQLSRTFKPPVAQQAH